MAQAREVGKVESGESGSASLPLPLHVCQRLGQQLKALEQSLALSWPSL